MEQVHKGCELNAISTECWEDGQKGRCKFNIFFSFDTTVLVGIKSIWTLDCCVLLPFCFAQHVPHSAVFEATPAEPMEL